MSEKETNDDLAPIRIVEVGAALLERKTATEIFGPALENLQLTLGALATLYASGNLFDRRQATCRSIHAITDFFTNQGVPFEVLIPIWNAALAADQSSIGIADPIFTADRSERSGRPNNGGMGTASEGVFAAIAELCIRAEKIRGARPYIKPGLALAKRMISSNWNIVISERELKKHRDDRDTRGDRLPDLAYRELTDGRAAKEMPLECAKQLLRNDRVALFARIKVSE